MAEQFKSATAPNADALPVVRSIFDFSAETLGELKTWFEGNPPAIPVTQVLGFSQFTAQAATRIATSESTSSTSYTNLATVGPTIGGLPSGKYVFLFGSILQGTAAPYMGLSINGSTPNDTDAIAGAPSSSQQVQSGTNSFTNSGGAGATISQTITFATSFAAAPTVVASSNITGTGTTPVAVTAVSTTQVTLAIFMGAGETHPVYWLAQGNLTQNFSSTGSTGIVATLSAASNTVTAVYKSITAGSATFSNRWLIALRYANP